MEGDGQEFIKKWCDISNQPLINNSGVSENDKVLEFKGKNGAEGRT